MNMDTNDPNYRRELQRETSEEGMSTAAWAGIAVAVMLVGGIAMYAFSSHESPTASAPSANPPATFGQGGAESKMPTGTTMPTEPKTTMPAEPKMPAAKEKAD